MSPASIVFQTSVKPKLTNQVNFGMMVSNGVSQGDRNDSEYFRGKGKFIKISQHGLSWRKGSYSQEQSTIS